MPDDFFSPRSAILFVCRAAAKRLVFRPHTGSMAAMNLLILQTEIVESDS